MHRGRFFAVLPILLFVGLLVTLAIINAAPPGAIFLVDSTADESDATPGDGLCASAPAGVCTLRAAVMEANLLPGGDTITFDTGITSITLSSSLPTITETLSIVGPTSGFIQLYRPGVGALLSYDGPAQNFYISGLYLTGLRDSSSGVILTAGTLTVYSSLIAYNAGGGGLNISAAGVASIISSTITENNSPVGGGILNNGNLTLLDSTVSRNGAGFGGGGIYNSGTAFIANSAVLTNATGGGITGGSGGGIRNGGTLTLVNSTLSGNSADSKVSSTGGGLYNSGVMTVTNSTLSNNTSSLGVGGGLHVFTGTVLIRNSIVANSTAGGDCSWSGGSLIDGGYNLIEDSSCGFTDGTDPLLGPLQDNGGPTFTHALLAGSAALDGGNPTACTDAAGDLLLIDQRSFMRPVDGDTSGSVICDIGAYEYGSTAATATPTPAVTNTPSATPSPTQTPTMTPTPPQGTTFEVDSSADEADAVGGDGLCASTPSGECTLRAAVMEANAYYGVDTIVVPAGVYTLTLSGAGEEAAHTGDLDVSADVNIFGAGAATTFVDGNLADRVFHITGNVIVNLEGLTIRRGQPPGQFAAGGGILNAGRLTLANSLVLSNTAAGPAGGINSYNILTVTNSTLQGNHGEYGGGGIFSSGRVLVSSSSLISNTANASVAGWGSGIWAYGHTTLINTTVSGNSAASFGIRNSGSMTLTHTTVANTGGMQSPPGDVIYLRGSIITDGCSLGSGSIVSQGYNLLTFCSVSGDTTGNITGNPLLGPLQDNGGPTWTHALLASSPAIDAADPASCPVAKDQRGSMRPADGDGNGSLVCDIGAFEYSSTAATATPEVANTPSATPSPTPPARLYLPVVID